MNKNTFTLILFVVVGLLTGSILSQLLSPVSSLAFLTKSASIVWQPKADLQVINYDVHLQVKLNLVSIAGVIAAIWIHRKL